MFWVGPPRLDSFLPKDGQFSAIYPVEFPLNALVRFFPPTFRTIWPSDANCFRNEECSKVCCQDVLLLWVRQKQIRQWNREINFFFTFNAFISPLLFFLADVRENEASDKGLSWVDYSCNK